MHTDLPELTDTASEKPLSVKMLKVCEEDPQSRKPLRMNNYYFMFIVLLFVGCNQKANHQSHDDLIPVKKKVKNEFNSISEDDILATLCVKSRIENKKVFLLFSFQACAWCRIFEKYHRDSAVNNILSKYIIIKMVDVNKTRGGSDLYKTYGKVGFPSWAIIDSTKKVIIDSGNLNDGSGNIGFPKNGRDIEYYISAIKKAAPSISRPECVVLAKKLNEYRPRK